MKGGFISGFSTANRSCGTVAIKNNLLFIADFSGLFHCLNAKTGDVHWTYDMLAAAWGSPLIVEGKVYIGDEDGDIAVLKTGTKMELLYETNMGAAVYTTPVAKDGVIYVASRTKLFAIEEGIPAKAAEKPAAGAR